MKVTYVLDEFKAWNSLKSRNWGALHVAVRPRETFGATGRELMDGGIVVELSGGCDSAVFEIVDGRENEQR